MNRYFSINHPVIFAHRGASAYAPENTLAAFQLAYEQGADGIELDAKLSADGEVVVMHDATLKRTTGVDGKVKELSFREIQRLDAGGWKGQVFRGEPVPSLREVFASLGDKLLINVELTNYGNVTDGLVEKVIGLVQEYHLQDQVLFSSFSPRNIGLARQLAPEVPAALLALKGWFGSFSRSRWMVRTSPEGIHPYWTDVTGRLVQKEKERGRFVNTWTVNDAKEMKRLFSLGVNGIFTDDPQLARQTLEEL